METVLGQEDTITFLRSRITSPPHIILWGNSGVGKTMLANAWITDHLNHQGIKSTDHAIMTLRLSSADDRGITAIRQRLTEFVRRRKPKENTVAWVLLDDADNLPVVTQQALRRIIELHAHQARFCFVAQNTEHFIEPIQSRCVLLECLPIDLFRHGSELMGRVAPSVKISKEAQHLMAALCIGNARQFTIIGRALNNYKEEVQLEDVHLLVNAPPVNLLLRLQKAIIQRDINTVTECVLSLWSKGYSFEDCISMLETVVRVYNGILTDELQYVLQCCAEGHVFQILNRMTTLDLIAILSGRASSFCLAESLH